MNILENFRRVAWPLAAGMLAAILVVTSYGANPAWIALAVLAVAAIAVSMLGLRMRPALDPPTSAAGSSDISGLPPMAREVFERLPDPLLLTDASGRVLFANRAMRGVIGIDAERKHVSALLRHRLRCSMRSSARWRRERLRRWNSPFRCLSNASTSLCHARRQ